MSKWMRESMCITLEHGACCLLYDLCHSRAHGATWLTTIFIYKGQIHFSVTI